MTIQITIQNAEYIKSKRDGSDIVKYQHEDHKVRMAMLWLQWAMEAFDRGDVKEMRAMVYSANVEMQRKEE